jgi:hypothetical protein
MQRSVALGHDSLWTLLQTEANTDGAAVTGDAGASLVIRQAFRRGVPLSLQPLCPGANEARDASRLSMPGDLPHCLPAWPNVELTGRRRQDARPGLAKMYRVPPVRAWWPAVGAPLERGVRPQCEAGCSDSF